MRNQRSISDKVRLTNISHISLNFNNYRLKWWIKLKPVLAIYAWKRLSWQTNIYWVYISKVGKNNKNNKVKNTNSKIIIKILLVI